MPEISRFFGTIVTMYYGDHAPPHFHARHGKQKALVAVESLTVLEGRLPPRALGMVIEWVTMHQAELLENWELARQQLPLKPIDPLE